MKTLRRVMFLFLACLCVGLIFWAYIPFAAANYADAGWVFKSLAGGGSVAQQAVRAPFFAWPLVTTGLLFAAGLAMLVPVKGELRRGLVLTFAFLWLASPWHVVALQGGAAAVYATTALPLLAIFIARFFRLSSPALVALFLLAVVGAAVLVVAQSDLPPTVALGGALQFFSFAPTDFHPWASPAIFIPAMPLLAWTAAVGVLACVAGLLARRLPETIWPAFIGITLSILVASMSVSEVVQVRRDTEFSLIYAAAYDPDNPLVSWLISAYSAALGDWACERLGPLDRDATSLADFPSSYRRVLVGDSRGLGTVAQCGVR